MAKLKLMTIVGTRPEIIRLSAVIKKCDVYFELILVHTGQNYDYELNQIFFDDLGLRAPDRYLDAVGAHLGETIGNIIAKSYALLCELKPDALLILGDTNSCLSAIAAKRLHIPIFHMEAGNRCFDECLPEETNRRIVDHIADVNLCYSEHARRYLNAEGTPRERTYVVGSPMAEVLSNNLDAIRASNVLAQLGLEENRYILLSAHREENIDTQENFLSLMQAVNALAERYEMPILYSCHPRSAKMIEKSGFVFHPLVRRNKPLGFHEYNHLQMHAAAVVSDSGTLPEEAAFFAANGNPFPAVCIRTSTERPEAMDKGNFILAGITTTQVLQAVETAIAMNNNNDVGSDVPDYSARNVSTRVVKLIQSYTGVVDRMVWRKTEK
ncbi:MAG: UDP-N-acetylglucosamine 2-epimerase (non-hydrolyzing) [Oscillospiraceae bacterium]|jgi:UDP-N-acetylglucosamine 2-epimerase (non-hydrolysing)|nr:UDP-N-acetylglucosamine 2-epimerase (non-hydrolyzing) [Oscillospiraceae bacterium]